METWKKGWHQLSEELDYCHAKNNFSIVKCNALNGSLDQSSLHCLQTTQNAPVQASLHSVFRISFKLFVVLYGLTSPYLFYLQIFNQLGSMKC